jgi:hypothetical protein
MVVCLVTSTGTRNGQSITTRMMELGRSNDAGQMAEAWWFPEDQYAGDEFFGLAQVVLPSQAQPSQPVTA